MTCCSQLSQKNLNENHHTKMSEFLGKVNLETKMGKTIQNASVLHELSSVSSVDEENMSSWCVCIIT